MHLFRVDRGTQETTEVALAHEIVGNRTNFAQSFIADIAAESL